MTGLRRLRRPTTRSPAARAGGPLRPANQDQAFWSSRSPAAAGIYVGYNDMGARPRRHDHRRPRRGVTGGSRRKIRARPGRRRPAQQRREPLDNNDLRPLRSALESSPRPAGPRRLLTGRATFSAAGQLRDGPQGRSREGGIRLVGEAPGGGLDIYGDVRVVTLPTAGSSSSAPSRHHVRAPGDDRLAIEPDRPAEVSWADYVAGRDPVLEAAVAP